MSDRPGHPSRPTRRSIVTSAAAVVAAALGKAREANAAQSPFLTAPTDQLPPPQGAPMLLGVKNTAAATTGLTLAESPRDPASSIPAMRFETFSAGIQVVAREFAEAVSATLTATAVLAEPTQRVPAPGILVVGRPAVIVTDSKPADHQNPTAVSESVSVAASAQASGVMLSVGDVGFGLIGAHVRNFDPATVSEALNVTGTAALVDQSTGVLGVAATGSGIRGRALLPGGIGGIFEAPSGEGEVGAKVKGDLIVEDGKVRGESAQLAGDLDVGGKLRVGGVAYSPPPPPPAQGSGRFPARTIMAVIAHKSINPSSFVQIVLTGPPKPQGVAVSHIDLFQGGCNVHLTDRTHADLPFNWIAFT